ncbi:protein of unknown function [Poseidonocella pacifica]|uniref:YjiS-like domain-containing protein n=1 Tax=Poseidonocella pacifica TaxID=871651 RepID=A0A1I0V2R6_9RHOB|nr:DUF1127 domain-containing protein [Poseidonocella pacifica]SFA70618.1 protein of unknown function [Poseidonocella pacifica]
MAYANTTNIRSGSFFDRLFQTRTNLAERWTKYQLYRKTRNELSNLSNRDLDDLGISRSMIHAIAMEAAYDRH